jgi:O-acetyl-ADP-ribose deacetylase (regulator of RNase III)
VEFTVYQHNIGRYLYYITHINNINSILEKGILSHEMIQSEGIKPTPIYDEDIVTNRKEKRVDGKSLWHFANLYFQPRNPMLYRVILENSPNDIAIIAVRKEILKSPEIYVTDGNAVSKSTNFYVGEGIKLALRQIEKATEWQWWAIHDSTKRKIMAECLVPNCILPNYIEAIYVSNHTTADKIRLSLNSNVNVIPEPNMFFQPVRKIDLTQNLSLVEGDLFFSKHQTLTVSVNCVGVMGKGLASRAKYQFPDVYVYYQDQCKKKELRMGRPVLYRSESSYDKQLADEPDSFTQSDDRWFLLFPTKQHYRDKSDINGIEEGLRWLVNNYKILKIKSLAIPALGCGLGRLDWKDVGPILCRYLSIMDIPVWVYLPAEKNIPAGFLTKEFLLPKLSV